MKRIGITGQNGFMGSFLFNTLKLSENKYKLVPFVDSFYTSFQDLCNFVSSCDVIVHLAGINRNNDPDILYNTNVGLVQQLIKACETTNSKPHILFASSIQEDDSGSYGRSKRAGRLMLSEWSLKIKSRFSGIIIPNVFGPFCKPYYNSVVATFCHQLTHNEMPEIIKDSEVKLIYIDELVKIFIDLIDNNDDSNDRIEVKSTFNIKVSGILEQLIYYKDNYFIHGIVPAFDNKFQINLFNTFASYIDFTTFFPFPLQNHVDARGSFTELTKSFGGGQVSFSISKTGIIRGNHFHTRKFERFIVLKGKARLDLCRVGTNQVMSFYLDGRHPSFVDIPVWHIHKLTNIGKQNLLTLFWTNEFFDKDNPDTYPGLIGDTTG
jgi:UDP-2-acetamido-2,6-beta-L-arabino-hexul-4-ose reductase